MRWLRSNAIVDAWFDNLRPEQQATARDLRDVLMAEEPALRQEVRWGNLVFSHHDTHALAIVTHKDHAHLQVFNGALLLNRFAVLEGTGKAIRHVKVRYRLPVDAEQLRPLIRASVDAIG